MPLVLFASFLALAAAVLWFLAWGRHLEAEAFERSLAAFAATPLPANRKAELDRQGRDWSDWVGTNDVTTSLSVAVSRRYQAVMAQSRTAAQKTARNPGGTGHGSKARKARHRTA